MEEIFLKCLTKKNSSCIIYVSLLTKEKKMARNVGKLKVKGRRYAYGSQILRFEKHCFDWVCAGEVIEDVEDGYEITERSVKRKHHIVKTMYFKRPQDYQTNFLFNLTEMLSNIISFFRVLALNLLFPAVVVGAIVMFFNEEMIGTVIGTFAGVYGGLIGASLLLAGLGLLLRKVFKLTEKTDEVQVKNGFLEWSKYEDDLSAEFISA